MRCRRTAILAAQCQSLKLKTALYTTQAGCMRADAAEFFPEVCACPYDLSGLVLEYFGCEDDYSLTMGGIDAEPGVAEAGASVPLIVLVAADDAATDGVAIGVSDVGDLSPRDNIVLPHALELVCKGAAFCQPSLTTGAFHAWELSHFHSCFLLDYLSWLVYMLAA